MDDVTRDDPDGGEHGGRVVDPSTGARPHPGDIVLPAGLVGPADPLVGRDVSTPLEDDEPEGTIPPCPLWAMKERRHIQWHLLPTHDRHDRIRVALGSGDDTVYVIDDGRSHVVVARRIGAVAGECEYCLLGRVSVEQFGDLRDGRVALGDAFDGADELAVCGVAIEEDIRSSNIFDVARYDRAEDVPTEYRAGAPFLHLREDLDITA